AKKLLDSIPKDSVSGLRDRALIAAMLYSFARVSAVLKLKVDDYYHNGARRWLRLHEKGGKEHEMPVHHLLEETLNEYIAAAGFQNAQPLFQSVNSLGTEVTGRALNRYNAWAAIRKRARNAGFPSELSQFVFLTGNPKPSTITLEPAHLSRSIESYFRQRGAGMTPLFIPRATQSRALHPLGRCIRQPNIESLVDPPHDFHGVRHQFAISYVDELFRRVAMLISEPGYVVRISVLLYALRLFRVDRVRLGEHKWPPRPGSVESVTSTRRPDCGAFG